MNAPFEYAPLLPLGNDPTEYRLVCSDFISTLEMNGETFVKVTPEGLTYLTKVAMKEIAHFLRTSHLEQLRKILDDPEASSNDRFVALDLLKNASIAASGILPSCQDTGTAIIMGKRGQRVLTSGGDEEAIARQMGIAGVPCFIVDGKYAISGAQDSAVLLNVFDLAYQDQHKADDLPQAAE